MNLVLSIHEVFGSHLSAGEKAVEFCEQKVDPFVSIYDHIVFDFSNVRNANSSFINALLTGLIEKHGLKVLKQISFKSCNQAIQVLIVAAVELASRKVANKAAA